MAEAVPLDYSQMVSQAVALGAEPPAQPQASVRPSAAPDVARIKRNIGKMLQQNAPEADVDAYVVSEGVTAEQLRAAPKVGVAEDIAKTAPAALTRGVGHWLGGPADIASAAGTGINWLEKKLSGETDEQYAARSAERRKNAPLAGTMFAPGGEDILDKIGSKNIIAKTEKKLTGPLYKPQTLPGQVVGGGVELVPQALGGPGGALRKVVGYGFLPGAAGEATSQAPGIHGTSLEPFAKGGAAIATGGVTGLVNRPGNVGRTVARGTEGVTPAQLDAAEALFQDALQRGTPITRAEALQHVTGGATNLGNLQRVVEGQGGMRDFFSQRPGQVEQGARQAFGDISAPVAQPATVGPAVGRAAEETVNDVRGIINRHTEPFYTAAAPVRLSPQEMAPVRAHPGWDEARNAVRNDPQLNRYVAHLPDDSVGFLNEVKKYLDTAAQNASAPVNAQRNMQRSAGYGQDAAAIRDAARRVSPDYQVALDVQEQTRRQFLEPILQGPLGKLADKDITTKNAIAALFPANPLPNSAQEITTAVTALAQRRPDAARQLVRAHAESTFNEASQRLTGGANEFGGPKFAAALRGNPQQAANLEAAVRALPNGDVVWPGFNRFLEILEAQGQRQRVGSQTAFNVEALQDLRRGGAVGDTATLAAGVGVKWPQKIKDTVERWRLGRGVDELADLFTNPEAGRRFRQLAESRNDSQALRIVGRLVQLSGAGR